jgi:hypothetical protein
MELSASVHMKATGTWPTKTSTVSWILVPGVMRPTLPASTETASHGNGNVIMTMTAVMVVMNWKVSVVSWTLGTFVRS